LVFCLRFCPKFTKSAKFADNLPIKIAFFPYQNITFLLFYFKFKITIFPPFFLLNNSFFLLKFPFFLLKIRKKKANAREQIKERDEVMKKGNKATDRCVFDTFYGVFRGF
jgi:hypothetical protein